MNVDILGLIAGGLTSIASMPQLIKVIKTRNVEDLSWLMLVILITGLSLWVWYGILQNELPIILSNAFAVLVNVSLLSCYLLFRDKNKDEKS
ncbi:SemiSWEET transporter [Chryseobacterium taihuense]|uniref:MtN3 and saliva related transmembrane protein n=1 Tax=Chryseobacterium taihuense TaxID=1141221 RepID=A0ABY0QYI1_9FLAO|nr:SemiSWEET transporter [Chryseobacterium taihuense]SDM11812.1 MtN3 and saliva related transmembrane protein [Chryseobacterium taihuense]